MIVISAGHFERQRGATHDGISEWELAVDWASRVAFAIGPKLAVFCPSGFLKDKCAFINGLRGVKLACEIHFNAATAKAHGSETLYYPGSVIGKALASRVQGRLGALMGPDRGVKEGYYRLDPAKGVDFFLKKTSTPSIIVEPAFLHDADLIEEYRVVGPKVIAEQLISFHQELT